jgi:hypothetical protein
MGSRDRVEGIPCVDDCQDCAAVAPATRELHYIGDYWGTAATALLSACQPYPGDPAGGEPTPNRFVVKTAGLDCEIFDTLTFRYTTIRGAFACLESTPLAWAYARERARVSGLDTLTLDLNRYCSQHVVDLVQDFVIRELEMGAPYPTDHWQTSINGGRFTINAEHTSGWCIFVQDALHRVDGVPIMVQLPSDLMDNPLFDLRQWYAQILYDRDTDQRRSHMDGGPDEDTSTGYDSDDDPDERGGPDTNIPRPGPEFDDNDEGEGMSLDDCPDLQSRTHLSASLGTLDDSCEVPDNGEDDGSCPPLQSVSTSCCSSCSSSSLDGSEEDHSESTPP